MASAEEILEKGVSLRGRYFSPKDLIKIKEVLDSSAEKGRTRLSEIICELLSWKQPNGWLKDRACRDVLRRLEQIGYLQLPPLPQGYNVPYSKKTNERANSDIAELPDSSPQFAEPLSGIHLRLAKGNQLEKVWNETIQRYHYLGHSVVVGKTLKFLIYSHSSLVGATCLTEPAWAVHDRDRILQDLFITREKIVNNSRFLILPSVKVKNLASIALAILMKDGVKAYEAFYSKDILMAETFVDSTRFRGTCYRASNWVLVGSTKGYRKAGSAHYNSQTMKQILLYPRKTSLRIRLMEVLKNERY